MSIFTKQPTPDEAAKRLATLVERAIQPHEMGVSPVHGVVFFAAKESDLSINETIIAVRIADLLGLAALLMQQSVVPLIEQVPCETLPRIKKVHKLFQLVDGVRQ